MSEKIPMMTHPSLGFQKSPWILEVHWCWTHIQVALKLEREKVIKIHTTIPHIFPASVPFSPGFQNLSFYRCLVVGHNSGLKKR